MSGCCLPPSDNHKLRAANAASVGAERHLSQKPAVWIAYSVVSVPTTRPAADDATHGASRRVCISFEAYHAPTSLMALMLCHPVAAVAEPRLLNAARTSALMRPRSDTL